MYAKVQYDRRSYVGGSGGCCGETKYPVQNRSFQPRIHPAVARYCDTIPAGMEADPEMIGEIIRDLHCVFEKTYGRKANAEARFRNLSSEVEELKDDLACCECCKEELENELIKLHPELKALQFALEEEIQKRACLESIIAQLRGQLARADAMLDADCRDKAAMQSRMKDLEAQINKLQDIIDCLTSERDDLARNCRSFDDYKMRQDDSAHMCGKRMEQLEDALAKCCKVNEELQKELICFGKERENLLASLEACCKEKSQMASEFDSQRRQWMEERDRLEQTISDLRKAVECLTAQNQEICDKMREVVSAHHREMDNLRREADKYKKLYEQELAARTKAEGALKQCQEQLRRNNLAECKPKKQEKYVNPCAEILAKINGRPWGGGGGGGSSACGGGMGTSTAGGGASQSSGSRSRIRGGANESTQSGGGGTSSHDSQQVSKLQNQLKVSQTMSADQEERFRSLESQIEKLQGQTPSVQSDSKDVEKTKLKKSLKDEKEKRERLEHELKVTQTMLETEAKAREEFLIQESSTERLDTFRLQHLQEKLKVSEANRLTSEETISELEEKLRKMESELTKAVAERKKIESELEEVIRRNLSLEELVEKEKKSRIKIQKDLDEKEERLQQQIQDKDCLEKKVTSMEVNNNNLQEQSQSELAQLREKLENEKKYRVQAEELKSKLDKAESNKLKADELFEKLKMAEAEKFQLKILQKQIESDKMKLKELSKLAQEGEERRLKIEELKNQLTESQRTSEVKLKLFQDEMTELRLKLQNTELKKAEIEELREMLRIAGREEKVEIEDLKNKLKEACQGSEELRKELEKSSKQKLEQEEILKDYKEKLDSVEPKLAELEERRRQIEQRLAAVVEENSRWKMIGEEHRVSLDLVQRELQDVQRMWETEVKAKGLLAEKIAKYERTSSLTDAKTKQETEYCERVKEKARQLKAELKAEREQSNKLKMKVDVLKEQCRSARDRLQELTSDPRPVQLSEQLAKQKAEHDKMIQQVVKEREALMVEFYRLGQEKLNLEREVKDLRGIQAENMKHKESVDKLMACKERLEAEMLEIKTLVNKRYVEKSVVDAMRKDHVASVEALKKQYESQAEQELSSKLTQIGAMLDTQNRDRTMIDTIRSSNEASLRQEFNAMVKNMKVDMERLNGLLKSREEEILTLRTCVNRFKDKVTQETLEKNELVRKLQRLSSSQETIK